MPTPKQSDPQYKLRLPSELKERVEAAAAKNNRSLNAEIVAALEEKYPPPQHADNFLKYMGRWMIAFEAEDDPERRGALLADINKGFAKYLPMMSAWIDPADGNVTFSAGIKKLKPRRKAKS